MGIVTVEEKVVQQACVAILNEVFEPVFSGFSCGSRPGRSQHDALDALHEGIIRRKIGWILDCDIEGFFDNLSHDRPLSFVEARVTDKRMLRLLRKWLRVGWIEDGKRLRRKLKEVKTELKKRMHDPLEKTGQWLASVMREFTNYHALPGNMNAPREFYTQIGRLWLRVIRRRSQKAKTRWTWERFYRLQRWWLPRPRLVHPYTGIHTGIRFDAKHSRQEPYAVVPHVRIPTGGTR